MQSRGALLYPDPKAALGPSQALLSVYHQFARSAKGPQAAGASGSIPPSWTHLTPRIPPEVEAVP